MENEVSYDLQKIILESGATKLGPLTITKLYNIIHAANKAAANDWVDTSGYSKRDYYEAIVALGEALMKRLPLSSAQAFAKIATENPTGKTLFAASRRAEGSDCLPSEAAQTGVTKRALPIGNDQRPVLTVLTEKAGKYHREHPELTKEQAFAKVYEANPALAAEERTERRALAKKFAT